MWRRHCGGLAGAGAGLIFAVACQLGPDVPLTDWHFVEGRADFVPVTHQDSMSAGWYQGTLGEMHEPRLHDARTALGMTVIRYLWVRAFDPAVAVRMVETPGRCTVVVAILDTREYRSVASDTSDILAVSVPGPRRILRRDSSEVSPQQCEAVHAYAMAAGLWSGPAKIADNGLDGDDVIFEIADVAGHRIAQRWTPRPGASPEFREVAGRFIALGNVDPRMRTFASDWSPWARR
jgi:hypothetical protein